MLFMGVLMNRRYIRVLFISISLLILGIISFILIVRYNNDYVNKVFKDKIYSTIDIVNDNRDDYYYVLKSDGVMDDVVLANYLYVIPVILIFSSFILFYLYVFNYNKRLMYIDKYLFNVLHGDYSLDIRDYDEDYLSVLKSDIYKVTVLLKESSDKLYSDKVCMEGFLSDISHQIKTPLTSMILNNELLLKDNIDVSMKKDIINNNIKCLERINFLVSSLLKMSRLDSGMDELAIDKCNVLDLIDNAIMNIEMYLTSKNISLNKDIDRNICIYVDYNWTMEAIINILKNASNYTECYGYIDISCSDNPIYTDIVISNKGSIDSEDMPNIFKRFYRGKNASSDSIGIGLNMSMNIINKENGEILVSSKDDVVSFTIRIYKH